MQQTILLPYISGNNLNYGYNKLIENSAISKSDTIQKETINSTEIYTEKMKINLKEIYSLSEGNYYLLIYCSDFNIRINFSILNNQLYYEEPSINKYSEPNTSYFYISENDN